MDTKKGAPPAGTSDASSTTVSTSDSIPQDAAKNQGGHGRQARGHWNKKTLRVLPADAKVSAFAIKCYDEQLPGGWAAVCGAMRQVDKKVYQIIGIRHDRDLLTDGIWVPAIEKPHYHIIIRCVDRKKRVRVRSMLATLGVVFRPGVDDGLWMNHGVETIGNYSGYATYLTHETDDAIRDGKELYDVTELVGNLTTDEILRVRDGYTRVSDAVHKVSAAELEQLDKDAYALGYNMGNFNTWYNSQSFAVRSSAKMRTIKESYERGVAVRIEENTEMMRVCIFIEGPANTGKTYAARAALAGKRTLPVGGGGTGKFDKLRPDHEAILIDDDVCPNLLNLTDNYICHAYKRNSSNPPWAGRWFVVTSNLDFDTWLEACGIHAKKWDYSTRDYTYTPHGTAMHTRFFVCKLVQGSDGVYQLRLVSPSTRGSADEQTQRAAMFMGFRDAFNATIATYKPDMVKVDFSELIDYVEPPAPTPICGASAEPARASGLNPYAKGYGQMAMSAVSPSGTPYTPDDMSRNY